MSKARKLNGRPCVMVPADLFLELARAHSHPYPSRRFWPEMEALQAKAYRKVREAKAEQ